MWAGFVIAGLCTGLQAQFKGQSPGQSSAEVRAHVPAAAANAGKADVRTNLPPQVTQAERFLAQRGWTPGQAHQWTMEPAMRRFEAARAGQVLSRLANARSATRSSPSSTSTATWQPLGPTAVQTASYGLVTGRVSSLALDPSDATGNHLYIGTTGGGVWEAQNADVSNASLVGFTPLMDSVSALGGSPGASISIGALTVQPGGTDVILAGTGDPNDALDSYYGSGILRSADGGTTWSLIQKTSDLEQGQAAQDFGFVGEGFAGFAWSTVNPDLVVAAVSQAYEGALVNANQTGISYEGLYYSTDAGATWHLARITDGSGSDVQGPLDSFTLPDGNAATSVVWNPVRKLFMAAVRYHGYYQSADGVTWTRMSAQPGAALTASLCPTNPDAVGSVACPIFRGTLAVNPQTGDTFAWTVDINNQDQGIWQDQCGLSAGACGNPAVSFGLQFNTAALEVNSLFGAATIPNGDYNLALAAVPSGQDTQVLAGANDLWETECAPNGVCNSWRNTTNTTTCQSAQVGEFQHALAWNANNPLEIFIGNDSGLWRSTDAIGETGAVCSASDATHFQNLNGGLGSLAEPVSLAQSSQTAYTMLAGLGVNGTAGVKSTAGATADWPQILTGEGGPVAIDSTNPDNWYVNNGPGVSIHECSQSSVCTQTDFGANAAVNDSDVGGDGYTMTTPAPFLVDALDPTQLLIGTCRVWRGAGSGVGWTSSNAISPVLDSGATGVACNGDSLIRSVAALALAGGKEVVYVGMYGALDGGGTAPGHVFKTTINPSSSSMPTWQDLTLNPVTNDTHTLNYYQYDLSSIYIDPHDTTGNTVYLTVEGVNSAQERVQTVYGSTDGGAHWAGLVSNLPAAPANSVVVDPLSSNVVYVATDAGVYFTTEVANCATPNLDCWSAFGSGLPDAPAVALSAAPSSSAQQVLVAATYGRGIWETPLWSSACTTCTEASPSPSSLTFPVKETVGVASQPMAVTLWNTGSQPLTISGITSSDAQFTETDSCVGKSVAAGASCTIEVTLTPQTESSATATLTIAGNLYGGEATVELNWNPSASAVTLSPSPLDFDTALQGPTEVGTTSQPLQATLQNAGSTAITISSVTVTGPFAVASDSCYPGSGTSALAGQSSCALSVTFKPTVAGSATGILTVTDTGGTQSIGLSGTGAAVPTDLLVGNTLTGSAPSFTLAAFPSTIAGQASAAQTISLSNAGGEPLESIAISASGPFQTTNNCTTQLTAEASCTISVAFTPGASQVGAQSGVLTVSDAVRTQTVALSGVSLAPPVFSLSPASLAFSGQQPGVASAPQTLTVTNSGGAPMANVGFAITGSAASSFTTGATTCGATLNNGSSCSVQVTFTPQLAGGVAATLTVSSSTLGVTPASIPLSGTALVSTGLSVSPTQLTFPAANVGQTTAAQTVTVSNTTQYAFSAVSATVSGPFIIAQNGCIGGLAAGANCAVSVEFQPATNEAALGTLTVSSPSIATASSVALYGGGGIEVSPATVTFSTTGVGATSSPVTLTVTNLAVTSSIAGLTLTAPPGFQLVSNNCTGTLAAQSYCTAGVEFTPNTVGRQSGSLMVTSSTLQATPVTLSGMGFDFTAAASGATNQTVASGQTATFTLAITPLGSQGTFSLQCPTLPQNASCIFNPAGETLATGVQGNVSVQVSTGSAAAANRPREAPWGALPVAWAVLLLPMAVRRRRSLLLVALLAATVCLGVSSCTSSGGGTGGGSSGGGNSSGATPAGTYSVPVTVSSTGIQHTVTFTLVVD